jgi:hypothetical protein
MEEDRKITRDDLRKATKEAVQYVKEAIQYVLDLRAERALMSPEDRRDRRDRSRPSFSTMEEALELGARGVFDYDRLDAIECAIRDSGILDNFVNGYIFGKILDNRYRPNYYEPARLCTLLIYEKYWDGIQVIEKEIDGIIYRVIDTCPNEFGDGWCSDITMLSVAELEETKFLDKIFPHYIRIK